MMSLNSNKRKGRGINNNNSKPGRSKILQEKNMALEGVYANARFMHTAASLVGSVVHVQVKNGNLYEGVFCTFSHQVDIVLEMAHLVDNNEITSCLSGGNMLPILATDSITEKLIFKLEDIVKLSAANVDLDYATKDNFTDTAISKFNGQVTEKELEPWDGPTDGVDKLSTLEGEAEDANGWDVNDMFRTNAEKYGVTSSYDHSLQGYTVKLERKNTDEYKRQEAKAFRIAQEIQSSPSYKARTSIENGDEEERFSAVVRPENNSNLNNRYIPPARRKPVHNSKTIRSSNINTQIMHTSNTKSSHISSQSQHNVSTPATTPSHSHYKMPSSTTSSNAISTSTPASNPMVSVSKPTLPHSSLNQPAIQSQVVKDHVDKKINGEIEKGQKTTTSNVQATANSVKETNSTVNHTMTQSSPPPVSAIGNRAPEKKREIDKKPACPKGRDEKTEEELKKFHATFNLSEESQEPQECKEKVENKMEERTTPLNIMKEKEEKPVIENEKVKESPTSENVPVLKSSTLNPNAEAFTPRAMRAPTPVTPTPPVHPNRIQPQGQVMPIQPQLMAGMAQPFFAAMAPQYVMSATPVSVSLTPPFYAASVSTGPRYRKAVPMTLQPRDLVPSAHVAAATGPPILATAAISTPPQLALQYSHSPGVMPTAGHQAVGYPQMYSMVGPRVLSPQPIGVMPTTPNPYGDGTHLPTHVYMSPHLGTSAVSTVPTHPVSISTIPQGTTGPHSNASTPHSHAPSPVHQPLPNGPHVTPAHTPTPTGHPGAGQTNQPVVFHGPVTHQHPLQSGPHAQSPGPSQNHHMSHVTQQHSHVTLPNYGAPPQQLVFMSQQHHPAIHGHPIHNQTPGSHAGTATHILQHIPTSATVHTPTGLANTPFVQHQGV